MPETARESGWSESMPLKVAPNQDADVCATMSSEGPEIIIVPMRPEATTAGTKRGPKGAANALPALGAALAEPAAAFLGAIARHGVIGPRKVEICLRLSFEGGTWWAVVTSVGEIVDVLLERMFLRPTGMGAAERPPRWWRRARA